MSAANISIILFIILVFLVKKVVFETISLKSDIRANVKLKILRNKVYSEKYIHR